jgi:two-component system response regulator (stage 0 sporulation protein F)
MKPVSILVTDDERGIRLTLKTALEADGYSVLEATNGREALEVVRENTPDLMILDLNMPVMDGMSVLEHMKTIAGMQPRVIVLTAYGSIPTAVKATRLGALDFLEKPITPEQLRRSVHSVLEEPELDVPHDVVVDIPGGYEHALDRIRKMLRMANYDDASNLLTKAADRRDQHSAEYFNLLGILYESQGRWRLARKCYDKSLSANERYAPARTNLQRLIELHRTGRSSQAVVLGDESPDLMVAQLPPGKN